MKFKVFASIIFGIIFPKLSIDSISVVLIILAMVPWFIQYIKSIEINGIGKFDLMDQKQRKVLAKSKDLIGKDNNVENNDYDFLKLIGQDTKLALAGLRIELERT